MVKLTGKNKINCAIFISGRGSNLKSIFKYSKKKISNINIKLVVSSKKNIPGIIFAKKNKINFIIINYKNIKKGDKKILYHLKKYKIRYIFLAGFMKILSKNFIKKFKNKIINIHPSLLPKYKGLNTHKRVLKNNEQFTGCTVHLVNSKLDSGKIILQKKIKILKKDDENSLSKRVLKVENLIYPRAVKKFISSNL